MKISYNWLSSYFEKTPPTPEKIAELLTAHAFEIESLEKVGKDTVLDVKVLPDRAHDCLSHAGIAKEVSVLSSIPLKKEKISTKDLNFPESNLFRAEVVDQKLCRRFSALVIENVEVKDSPLWLQEHLKSIGQRPINNIVDATNYVMFATGQPLHAYDRELLKDSGGGWKIGVRLAHDGEKLTALDGKEYTLTSENLVIADGNTDKALGIAGVKGGKATEITEKTKNIILEAANFDPISVRKTAKKLGLRTDASVRFENEITPELTSVALAEIANLILEIAGGGNTQVEGMFDFYSRRPAPYKVGVSLSDVRAILGISISQKEIEVILNRRGYEWILVKPQENIMAMAEKLIGVPYVYGSSIVYDAPRAFDCSSFTSYLYAQSGIAIPRMSVDQFVYGEDVSEGDLQPGDLIFSNSGNGKIHAESVEFLKGTKVPEGVDHVGLYVGNGEVIHSTKGQGVIKEKINESERFKNIIGYRRIRAVSEERFVLTVPAERLDLRLKEDLVEEIGRIYGYENILLKEIKLVQNSPEIEKFSYYASIARSALVKAGFSEVLTYAFSNEGEEELLNPLAGDKKFLRSSLSSALVGVLEKNTHNADLLGLSEIKIFEIGTVFTKGKESTSLAFCASKKDCSDEVEEMFSQVFDKKIEFNKVGNVCEADFSEFILELPDPAEEIKYGFDDTGIRFKPYSPYPCIVRDIAVFVPEGSPEDAVLEFIKKESGELLLKTRLFDVFTKVFPDGTKKTSYAYRLIFQSFERTLIDEEANAIMEKVTNLLNAQEGWQVR